MLNQQDLRRHIVLLSIAFLWVSQASASDDPVGMLSSASAAAFSRDGKLLITCCKQRAEIWDLATGKRIRSLEGHNSNVHVAAFSPDGKLAVTSAGTRPPDLPFQHVDMTTRAWNVSDGKERWRFTHVNEGYKISFSPNGAAVLVIDLGGDGAVLDVETGKKIFSFHALGQGHRTDYYMDMFSPAVFSRDGMWVLAKEARKDDGFCVVMMSAFTGMEMSVLKTHDHSIQTALFSPDNQQVVTASWDKTARIWDVQSHEQVHVLHGHNDLVENAEFSPDGTMVLTSSQDGSVRLWSAATAKEIGRWKFEGRMHYALFSSDGRRVLAKWGKVNPRNVNYDASSYISVWDRETGHEIKKFLLHKDPFTVISSDRKLLMTREADDSAKLWNLDTGKPIREFK